VEDHLGNSVSIGHFNMSTHSHTQHSMSVNWPIWTL